MDYGPWTKIKQMNKPVNKELMKNVLLAFLLLVTAQGYSQSLTIEECYSLAEKNYPLVKQRELITRSTEYSMQNLSSGHMPQVSINGQATYQSEVTQIPIKVPGQETLSKDQYKLYAEINQSLFDGGLVRQQKQSQEVNAMVEQQKLEVELYKLKERINQLFFGVLLVDEQIKQAELLKNDIKLGMRKTEGALANGTAFKSSLDILKAELLKANQRTIELTALRKAYLEMLGLFINRELDAQVTLAMPVAVHASTEITRPELLMYAYQAKGLDAQNKILSARNLPRLNLFVQGGYGRPALNMLSNNFEPYYIGGVRLNWSLSGLYTTKRERAQLDITRKNIDVQKETFLFNTNFTLKQQNGEVNKYNDLLVADEEIVALRTSVKNTASVQLENGVINTNDYLREVNAEDQARQNRIVHEIQSLMAQYALQTTTGNAN
jgi:outer membrane protein TolC